MLCEKCQTQMIDRLDYQYSFITKTWVPLASPIRHIHMPENLRCPKCDTSESQPILIGGN